ncbi:MAG: hypothetical protein KJT03_07200 [Verrucomicrobiae bacterium]|nr:hypothetical protein [Verrucomicrobiae bacterium]
MRIPFTRSSLVVATLWGWAMLGYSVEREPLILTLEDAIGPPPEKEEVLVNIKRETFYTLSNAEKDPEIEELIEKERMGFFLTEEEQLLVREYRMGGRVSGGNTLMRKVYPPVLNWTESSLRLSSGKRYPFIICVPNANDLFPVALVLDPEIEDQLEAGNEEFSQVVRRMNIEAELPYDEAFRGRYITNSFLGNQLISHAVSVIIPIRDTLTDANTLTAEDWKTVLDYFLKRSNLDRESLFVLTTKEYADAAIRIGTHYPLSGLMMEEPETGLFGTVLPTNTEDSMRMASLLETYKQNLDHLTAPLLVLRNKTNTLLDVSDMLFLQPLVDWGRPLYLSMTDLPLRKLEEPDASDPENKITTRRFAYDFRTAEKVSNRILHFIQSNGKQPLRLLPEESQEPRMRNRTASALAELERIEGRLQGFVQDPENFNFDSGSNFDGSPSGGGFGDFEELGDLSQDSGDSP